MNPGRIAKTGSSGGLQTMRRSWGLSQEHHEAMKAFMQGGECFEKLLLAGPVLSVESRAQGMKREALGTDQGGKGWLRVGGGQC